MGDKQINELPNQIIFNLFLINRDFILGETPCKNIYFFFFFFFFLFPPNKNTVLHSSQVGIKEQLTKFWSQIFKVIRQFPPGIFDQPLGFDHDEGAILFLDNEVHSSWNEGGNLKAKCCLFKVTPLRKFLPQNSLDFTLPPSGRSSVFFKGVSMKDWMDGWCLESFVAR